MKHIIDFSVKEYRFLHSASSDLYDISRKLVSALDRVCTMEHENLITIDELYEQLNNYAKIYEQIYEQINKEQK